LTLETENERRDDLVLEEFIGSPAETKKKALFFLFIFCFGCFTLPVGREPFEIKCFVQFSTNSVSPRGRSDRRGHRSDVGTRRRFGNRERAERQLFEQLSEIGFLLFRVAAIRDWQRRETWRDGIEDTASIRSSVLRQQSGYRERRGR